MSSTSLCQFCKAVEFKYVCPKCNSPFCSVACYKSEAHLQCSEEFYKNCVKEEMALMSCPNSIADIPGLSDDIIRMYKVLKRFESRESTDSIDIEDFDFDEFQRDLLNERQLDSDDDDDDHDEKEEKKNPDISERLKGVNLNDPDAIWERLTTKEKNNFEAIVQKGEIAQILPAFNPWWTIQKKKKLIEDVCDESDVRKTAEVKFCNPKVIENIEPFEKLMKKEPSPCVRNNLINILASYTCTVRFFNGEHHTCPQEAASYLVALSATLKKNANFDDEDQAIKSVVQEGQIQYLGLDNEDAAVMRKDVQQILDGPHHGKPDPTYMLSALSDIHKILNSAKASIRPKKAKPPNKSKFFQKFPDSHTIHFEDLTRQQLTQFIKKIEFFLSFVHSKK